MKIILFWKPFFWLLLICYGLFLPAGDLPIQPFLKIPYFDKMVHFTLFFILCILLLRPYKKLKLQFYLLAPVTAILLGGILEFIQHFISSTRSSSIFDFLANSAGILAAVIFYSLFISGKKWEKLF